MPVVGSTVSHYEILEKLGQGGMGVVYRARDTRLERDVALKFLPPAMAADEDAKARFMQEAKAASALDHPNICTIYDIGESDDGRLFIAMSFYEGETLKYRLMDGALPSKDAASIAFQIALGLREAHRAGIIHRDVKPANIMVTRDDRVKILDFGVAKLGSGADLTTAGTTVGTTAYMSPEQARGEEVDHRTDLWSLGTLLYEMLSGERTFGAGYDHAVLYSILNVDPEPLTDIPEDLADLVVRLMKKDPADRPSDADDVLDALEPHASGVTSLGGSGTTGFASAAAGRPILKWGIPATAILLIIAWALTRPFSGDATASDDSIDPNLIAILPFTVQGGEDMEYLAESMVTLLSTKLDGVGSFYTVDDAAVIEQTRSHGAGLVGPSLGSELADRFGAGFFILGSVVQAGDEQQISARLYRTDGSPANEASTTYGDESGFMAAIDRLASGLVAGLLTDPNQDLSALAAGTTDSFEALRHYLEAEKLTRAGDHERAREEVDAALALDSTFALAWYLRAEIQGWLNVGTSHLDLEKAAQYAADLTGRARRLLDAEISFDRGDHLDAERRYRSLLRDYPNDLEATGQLAEVLLHYSSSESEQREALALLEKASRMTPGSRQFAFHHSDLLAFFGLIDGDSYPLDSLAAVYAGMALPDRGDTLDWSRALDRMNSSTARSMVLHARINGSPEDSADSYQRPGSSFDAGRALMYGRPELGVATVRTLGHMPVIVRTNPPLNIERLSRMALGQFREAARLEAIPADVPGTAPAGLALDVLTATIPAFDVSPDSLRQLRSTVQGWDPAENPLVGHPEDSYLVRAYLMAILSFSTGDRDAFLHDHAAYRALGPDSLDHPIWRSVSNELRALDYWQEGQLGLAASAMQDAVVKGVYFLRAGLMAARHQPTWYLGEIMELQGNRRAAIEQFTSVVGQTRFAAPGWERSARLYDELGEPEEAIRYYDLMIDIWEDADSRLQPRVEAARARRDALLDDLTREPATSIAQQE